jgi:Gram-positive signal peptide protein, YSIRK family
MFNKRQRFSIRKLSVGVASVLVGLMSISAMAPVSAQEAAAEAEIAPATEEAGDVVGESEEVDLPSGASTDADNNDQSGKIKIQNL